MQKLRQKQINDFINTLNEREQEYLQKQIAKAIDKRRIDRIEFTINHKERMTICNGVARVTKI